MMKERQYPPFRWYMLLCLAWSHVAVMSVIFGPSTLVDKIALNLNVGLGTVYMITMSVVTAASLLSNIVSGFFIDKLGMVWCWIVAMTLIVLSSLLWLVLSGSIVGLIVLRGIQGLAIGPVMASIASLSAAWFKRSEMSFAAGIASAAAGLGISVGLVAVPLFLRMTGRWQMAMALLGAFALSALALNVGALLGPKPPQILAPVMKAAQSDTSDFARVWKQPTLLAVLGLFFLQGWALQGYNVLVPNYLGMAPPVGRGLGSLAAGALASLIAYGVLTAGLIVSVVNERIFGGNSTRTLIVSSLIAGLLCLSISTAAVCQNGAILSAVLFLSGLMLGLAPPVLFAFLARNYSFAVLGRIGGIMQGSVLIGTTVGVSAGSVALDATGGYLVPIVFVSGVAILAALVATRMVVPPTLEQRADPFGYQDPETADPSD